MDQPKNVFIGSSCTHVPLPIFPEYKRLIESVADLNAKLFNVKSRYALEDSDPYLPDYQEKRRPAECYRMDRELVEQSELMIAEASFPSTGLGQELQVAAYNNIPVILIYKDWGGNIAEKKDYTTRDGSEHSIELGNKIVSVMVQGNPSVIHEVFYKDIDDCVAQLEAFLSERYAVNVTTA